MAAIGSIALFRDSQEKILGFCTWVDDHDTKITSIHDLYTLPHPKTIAVGTPLLDTVKQKSIELNQMSIELQASHYGLKKNFYQNRNFILSDLEAPVKSQKVTWYNPEYTHGIT